MNGDEEPSASRQFVATSSAMSSKWTMKRLSILTYLIMAAMIGLIILGNTQKWDIGAMFGILLLFVVAGVGMAGYFWWRSRQKIVVGVTGDGLTLNQRPGAAFSLAEAQLGSWVRMGVALHLQCGSHRLLLGGRDCCIAPTTRLDAPPVEIVDAWLWSPEFDELLFMNGRRSGLDVRGPASGEPTRCLLFPNPLLAGEMSKFAIRKQIRLQRSVSRPSLVIDLDADAIRVIEPSGDALSASASLAQVSATPANYGHSSDEIGNYLNTVPAMVVCIPGMPTLPVGCRDYIGLKPRFSWRGDVRRVYEQATYSVSGGDWLTLADKFGLTPYLEISNAAG